MTDRKKEVCRLCYYETADTVDIFSEKASEFDYKAKIIKYLYLAVSESDDLPKTVCWMCTQNLETFHRFYEKINEIQKSTLKDGYERIALHPHYREVQPESPKESSTVVDDEGNLYEIFVESARKDVDNDEDEVEEYELLEVDVSDAIENDKQPIDSLPIVIEKEKTTQTAGVKQENSISTLSKRKASDDEESPKRRSTRLKQLTTALEKASTRNLVKKILNERKHSIKSNPKLLNRSAKQSIKETAQSDLEHDDDVREGESDDEFPARNSDDEDWPSQTTLNDFPKEIIRDGLLLIKGKELMTMICRFYNLECKQCTSKHRFKHLNDLFEHYKSDHGEPGHIECCQTKLQRYPAIIMHMARHLQPDAFKCDECGYVVTRPRFLQTHKQTHLPEEQKPFGCDECSRRFCWKSALRILMISHQPAEERKQYICPVCDRTYDTPGGLSTHKKMAHSERKPSQSNICHLCAKNFATRTGLQEHMLTIHQPREKGQVQCNECGKWLMNQRCLKTHMILHSKVELRCDQCEYVTKKKVLLNRHRLTQHSTEKPFTCNLCGLAFKMKRALTVHVAQHGTTTTFQCPFCPRKFNSSTNFYTHRKSAHPAAAELAELKLKEEEEQRRKRIKAGVEEDPTAANSMQSDSDGSDEIVTVLQII